MGSYLYVGDVKTIGDTKLGIMTQCVLHKTVDHYNRELLSNIAFKINMKLGGINYSLQSEIM